jgi:hypothetical protein
MMKVSAYLMKVILSVPDEGYYVPDEGYFERTWWRLFWAYLMKVILSVPDEGYTERTWWRLLRTWWRLFQKRFVSTKFDLYIFLFAFNKIFVKVCVLNCFNIKKNAWYLKHIICIFFLLFGELRTCLFLSITQIK